MPRFVLGARRNAPLLLGLSFTSGATIPRVRAAKLAKALATSRGLALVDLGVTCGGFYPDSLWPWSLRRTLTQHRFLYADQASIL